MWSNVSFSIDGRPVDVTDVTYEAKAEPEYGCDLSMLRQPAYTATAECVVPIASLDAFASLFRREPVGASHATLAKRIRYGGRKGRSAKRRLLARALPMVLSTGYAKFHGKGVMLDETEMLVRLRSAP